MDEVTAYLNSEIDVFFHIEAITGYKTLGKVCLPRRTIYGLKQSARHWSKNLARSMILAGLKRLISDYSTFAKNLGTSKVVIVIVCVDDFLFFGPDIQEINTVKKYLVDQYKMKDLGPYDKFMEIKLDRDTHKKTISLSQKVCFRKVLDHVGMSNRKPALSPIVANINLTRNPEDATDEELIRSYQSHIGTHMWAYVCSRLDLGYAMSTLSQFFFNLTRRYMIAVKHVYSYLQATKDLKIIYQGRLTEKPRLEIYTDVDWAGNEETRKRTSGYSAMLIGCPVFFSSKRQSIIAQSSKEAEYIAASKATKEAVCIGRLLEKLCQSDIDPIPLNFDNQGSIALTKNPENHQRTKQIDVRYHYI